MNGARHSPPDTGGVDATSRRSREASFNGADGVVENGTSSKECPAPLRLESFPPKLVHADRFSRKPETMFRSGSRGGCGKCGKAEAFFAEAFPSSSWKSSIKSRRRRPLSISTAAAFSTAARARRFRRADEEIDIRNGKDSSKVRNRIQTSTDRTDRSRPDHHRAGRARSSDIEKRHRTMARSVSQQRPGRSSIQPGAPIGGREREAPSQSGRARHADGLFKKIASLGSAAEKRRYIDHHRKELGSISKACQVAGLPASTF